MRRDVSRMEKEHVTTRPCAVLVTCREMQGIVTVFSPLQAVFKGRRPLGVRPHGLPVVPAAQCRPLLSRRSGGVCRATAQAEGPQPR